LGACGEDPDVLAAERCKGAVRETPLFLAVVER
jgi:hypothetical protein